MSHYSMSNEFVILSGTCKKHVCGSTSSPRTEKVHGERKKVNKFNTTTVRPYILILELKKSQNPRLIIGRVAEKSCSPLGIKPVTQIELSVTHTCYSSSNGILRHKACIHKVEHSGGS